MGQRGTPDDPLSAHAVAEERARVQGDIDAALRSAMVRAYVPAGATLTVPDRHQVTVQRMFQIDADAALVLAGDDALLNIVAHDDSAPVVLTDRSRIFGFNATPFTASAYLFSSGAQMQAALGYVMDRPGAVVGAAFSVNCTVATSPGSFLLRIRKNGINVFSVSLTITATGIQQAYLTQSKVMSRFVAGDVLTLYQEFGTFVGTLDDIFASATLELAT